MSKRAVSKIIRLLVALPNRNTYCYRLNRLCSSMASEEANGTDFKSKLSEITEGKANILHPTSVFYNPVQEFNRDLTIAVVSELAQEHIRDVRNKRKKQEAKEAEAASGQGSEKDTKKATSDGSEEPEVDIITGSDLVAGQSYEDGVDILEALAASGLRSVRFGLEIPGVRKVLVNDFDKTAVEIIKMNIERNNLGEFVEANHGDASVVMLQHKSVKDRFHVVDLDPYGSAAPFLDTAVQSVADGGIMCVTCTDAAVLCGNTPEKCFTMYGSMSLKSKAMHEIALRIILRSISLSANRYSRYIVPVLSLSIDFYFRLFVRVYTGQYQAKYSAANSGLVYFCTGCGSHAIQPMSTVGPGRSEKSLPKFVPGRGPPVSEKCEHCGFKHQVGGPLYIGPLHDTDWIDKVIGRVQAYPESFKTHQRIVGMLQMVKEELDEPLFYETDELFKVLKVTPMKMMEFRSAILNAGYKVSFSHACKNSIKTDAPVSVLWDILRKHCEQYEKSKHLVPGTPGHAILSQKPTIEVNFEPHPDANPVSREKGLSRFPVNPERNWGPKPRAKKVDESASMEDRRQKNQGKRKRNIEKEEAGSDNDERPTKIVETEAAS